MNNLSTVTLYELYMTSFFNTIFSFCVGAQNVLNFRHTLFRRDVLQLKLLIDFFIFAENVCFCILI